MRGSTGAPTHVFPPTNNERRIKPITYHPLSGTSPAPFVGNFLSAIKCPGNQWVISVGASKAVTLKGRWKSRAGGAFAQLPLVPGANVRCGNGTFWERSKGKMWGWKVVERGGKRWKEDGAEGNG